MAIDEPVIVLKSFKFIAKAFIVCLVMCEVLITESVAQRCSVKKVFLEISQNSQENTYARVSFLIK